MQYINSKTAVDQMQISLRNQPIGSSTSRYKQNGIYLLNWNIEHSYSESHLFFASSPSNNIAT